MLSPHQSEYGKFGKHENTSTESRLLFFNIKMSAIETKPPSGLDDVASYSYIRFLLVEMLDNICLGEESCLLKYDYYSDIYAVLVSR